MELVDNLMMLPQRQKSPSYSIKVRKRSSILSVEVVRQTDPTTHTHAELKTEYNRSPSMQSGRGVQKYRVEGQLANPGLLEVGR